MHPVCLQPIAFPARPSLVSQVANYLRDAIVRERWCGALPGEHHLCGILQVSRPTLREALRLLEQEGLISTRQGRARTILRSVSKSAGQTREVSFLCGQPLDQLSQYSLLLYTEASRHLQAAGFGCGFHVSRRFVSRKPEYFLEKLVRQTPSKIWVLMSVSVATQKWFYDRGLPVLLLGHRHEGVELPALDIDYFGISQHAGRLFSAKGHESVALIFPEVPGAGDLLSQEGFLAGVSAKAVGRPLIVKCGEGRAKIAQTVRRLLRISPKLSGVFVCGANLALALCSCLVASGVDIPRDISVIARDGSRALDYFFPDVTRYLGSSSSESRKLCALIRDFAIHGAVRPTVHLILPTFHPGETLNLVPVR